MKLKSHPVLVGVYATADGRIFQEVFGDNSEPYPGVTITNPDHKRLRVRRHTIVAEAFHGARPAGMVVRHKNGVPGDDRAENLEWGTHGDNMRDMARHGVKPVGERHGMAKLTYEDVRDIIDAFKAGEGKASIAKRYGISKTHAGAICSGRFWKEMPR